MILFGSRARGDYGPESDWDIGLVFDGEPPSLDGLPLSLEDRRIDWAPFEHSHAMRRLNVCGLPHAMAADGVCLHGDPLPRPARKDVNIRATWDYLSAAHGQMSQGMNALVKYWNLSLRWRWGYDTAVAGNGATAGELLCKAALSMRGLEPKRSHLVTELCDDLEREFPDDPLLPLLRDCDGQTAKARLNIYPEMESGREDVDLSARRLAAALRASGAVLAAACEISVVREGREFLGLTDERKAEICHEMEQLHSNECPQEIRREIQAGIDAWPDSDELWNLLMMPPPGRDPESADRGGRPPGR